MEVPNEMKACPPVTTVVFDGSHCDDSVEKFAYMSINYNADT